MPAESFGGTLAIDVGATRTRLAVVADGALVARDDRLTGDLVDGDGTIVEALASAACALLGSGTPSRPDTVGVAIAAAVGRDGSVLEARPFGVPAGPILRDALALATGLPVVVHNDANAAAFAEVALGAARGATAAGVVTLGTNIGLGLVMEGRLVLGSRGAAGEAGLLLVPAATIEPVPDGGGPRRAERLVDAGPFGEAGSCAADGYAWLEEVVGGGTLSAAAATAVGRARGDDPIRFLAPVALADPRLAPLANRAVEGWAWLVANLTVVLDLDLIVLTGALAVDAAIVLDRLRTRVAELVARPPTIRIGTLGPDAELLGAALLARAALAPRAESDAGAGPSARRQGGDR